MILGLWLSFRIGLSLIGSLGLRMAYRGSMVVLLVVVALKQFEVTNDVFVPVAVCIHRAFKQCPYRISKELFYVFLSSIKFGESVKLASGGPEDQLNKWGVMLGNTGMLDRFNGSGYFTNISGEWFLMLVINGWIAINGIWIRHNKNTSK